MDRLNDHIVLHMFLMMNHFYDIIKFSTVNKYINDYFKCNKNYIFNIKFATDLLFVDSFYSYFLVFTGSINNRVNNLINCYNNKIQKVLSVIPVEKKCEELKLAQLEFIQNIKYGINHKCVYSLLFCPSYILFRDLPAIEHWYLIIRRHEKMYSTLNVNFFNILKYHLINLNKSHPQHFKNLIKLNIEIGHFNSDYYNKLFNIFYTVNPQLFKNTLYDILKTNTQNKNNLNSESTWTDNIYDNYIDFTNEEIQFLYNQYNLNEDTNTESDTIPDTIPNTIPDTFNKLHKLVTLVKC